ncbi:beta-N-acetylglucosaminidase domain-containing protein [Streptacidiphilus cavernicola]|uniref:Beta-N-acetylglucosaminidase domain-containing protein n=1 Tax=Streptacidiphilus cavernicola TaxID=3342716 RepID=A0ABV6VS20_9ACTN
MEHRPSLPAAVGGGLRRQLEQHAALQSMVSSGPVLSARRTAARTARRLAPETADRLISELKGTRPLLDRARSAAGQGRRRSAALRASAALTVAAVVGGGMVTGAQGAYAVPAVGRVGAAAVPGSPTGSAAASAGSAAPAAVTVPQVFPRPQAQQPYGAAVAVPAQVTLVLAAKADPGAVQAVREVLTGAGARRIDESADGPSGAPAAGSLTVYLGGLAEGAGGGADRALRDLASAGGQDAPLSPSGLPSGGYVLAAGRTGADGAGAVVLAGVDAAGTFNAAQSLRQLVVGTAHGPALPGVRITDWPTTPVRGTEEGFYGTPWTPEQTRSEIDFLGRSKQNYFLYAPGDDPYRNSRWRDPYPAAQQAQLRALAQQAALDHVTLGYGLALGGSVCFTSAKDKLALLAKLDQLWGLGVRSFQLQFQDSSFTHWHCDADHDRYGLGPAATADAQSDLVQLVLQRFLGKHPGAAPLSVLPTEFYQDGATPYRSELAERLDPSVQVAWTGVGVQPGTITAAQTAAAAQAFGHPLVTQDNYVVNDSAPDRLYLGPYLGREAGVATGSAALLVNAMQQPEASRIPLATAADYAWNPAAYDPAASWQAATRAEAAAEPQVQGTAAEPQTQGAAEQAAAAVSALAGNSASAAAGGGPESAYLRPLVAAFRLGQGSAADTAALRAAFTTMATAPQVLAAAHSPLGAEDAPWLAQLSAYGQAGQAAVDMLAAQRSGDGARAWSAQVTLRRLVTQLAQARVTVGEGVLDPFLKRALAASNSWSGVGGGQAVPSSSMDATQGHDLSQMVDGDPDTYYWSDAPPQVDDTVGIDLGSAQPVGTVTVRMGADDGSAAAGDYLQHAVLEYSSGDGGWHRVGAYSGQRTVSAVLPAGTVARYLRLRATATQTSAVAVSEFSVSAPSSTTATVTGGPAGQPGASAAQVADGDLAAPYRAVASPQAGDALTMTLGSARPMDRVVVLTDPDVASVGSVEVHPASAAPGQGWVRVGALADGYTELPVDPKAPVDRIRLVWAAGGPPPVVNQIVPWYADTPTAALRLPEQSVDLEVGSAPVTLTGELQALGVGGASGTVAAAPPKGAKGLTVGAPGAVALSRGGSQALPLVFRAADGTAPGTYTVPVGFTAAGHTVTQQVQVHVYPRTEGPDLALTATATSSGDETPDFPASAVNDGSADTRWSSPAQDDAWVQLQLAQPATLGEAVLHWQDAYAAQYLIQTSADGQHWTTAATVLNGAGGDETVHFDAPDVRYVRMQGVQRATRFGYSLYGIELYAVAGTAPVGTPVSVPPPVLPSAPPTGLPTGLPSGLPSAPAAPPAPDPVGPLNPGEPG